MAVSDGLRLIPIDGAEVHQDLNAFFEEFGCRARVSLVVADPDGDTIAIRIEVHTPIGTDSPLYTEVGIWSPRQRRALIHEIHRVIHSAYVNFEALYTKTEGFTKPLKTKRSSPRHK
jgi:hypothetical protein